MATTADYLNKLVTQKNAFVDNLITKGVAATYDETLETLIPKILNINGGGDSSIFFGNTILFDNIYNLDIAATGILVKEE